MLTGEILQGQRAFLSLMRERLFLYCYFYSTFGGGLFLSPFSRRCFLVRWSDMVSASSSFGVGSEILLLGGERLLPRGGVNVNQGTVMSTELPSENTTEIVETLAAIMKKMGISFTFKGRPVTYAEVLSEKSLLPAIARRADQLSALCLGYGIGVNFEDAPGSTTGLSVTFDTISPNALRYLCLVDVLCELAKAAPDKRATPLDDLLYD